MSWEGSCSYAHPATQVDVYPTVAALAGLPPPPGVEGTSLMPAFLEPGSNGDKQYAFSEFPQCPSNPDVSLWHTGGGCQNVPREQLQFFGFSIRSQTWRYTEWHPWIGSELRADWQAMTGVELYDYRTCEGCQYCPNQVNPLHVRARMPASSVALAPKSATTMALSPRWLALTFAAWSKLSL